jgi:YceI-like domain
MPYELGPDCGTLTVRTGKAGAAAKAGHNLRMEVGDWHATLDLGDAPSLTLSADSRSFRVIEGSGGVMPLGDEEKAAIPQTIDEEVLKGTPIVFHSTRVDADGGDVAVDGELELAGARHPVSFRINVGDDGHIQGAAKLKQSDWGMKPYSALFGTLKVADEVEIAVDANARSANG